MEEGGRFTEEEERRSERSTEDPTEERREAVAASAAARPLEDIVRDKVVVGVVGVVVSWGGGFVGWWCRGVGYGVCSLTVPVQ